MEVDSTASAIENLLKTEGLSFKKTKTNRMISFRNIKIGEEFSINLYRNSICTEIILVNQEDIEMMHKLIEKFIKKLANFYFTVSEQKSFVSFRLYIRPAKFPIFKEIFPDLSFEFQQEVSPFILGIVTEKPEEFFIKQYRIWQTLPSDEKEKVLEQILSMKENYFRNAKTQFGIIKKLNQTKKEIAVNFEENIEYKVKDKNSVEFYLLDFAALFRAIELGLIKLRLCDFFEDFNLRGGK